MAQAGIRFDETIFGKTMKHRAFTAIELVVVIAIIGILAAILLPVFNRTYCDDRPSMCRANLQQIALAWQQYASDYNGVAPTLITNGQFYGWSDALTAYGANAKRFHCPSSRVLRTTNPIAPGYSDYWTNSRLAGRSLKAILFPVRTIAFGEGENGDARYALSHLPQIWRNAPTSPAFRHREGANYLFADGHAQWLRPEKVTVAKPGAGQPTFAVK